MLIAWRTSRGERGGVSPQQHGGLPGRRGGYSPTDVSYNCKLQLQPHQGALRCLLSINLLLFLNRKTEKPNTSNSTPHAPLHNQPHQPPRLGLYRSCNCSCSCITPPSVAVAVQLHTPHSTTNHINPRLLGGDRSIYVYTVENPPPDNSGQIMQINSPPWLRGQAQWGAGKIKLVLVLSGCTNVRAGPGG